MSVEQPGSDADSPSADGRVGLAGQIVVMTAGRTLMNTALRFPYPFLPELARGLGTSLTSMGDLVALGNLAGFLGPFLSPLSERFGRRPVMVVSMALFALACLLVVALPIYWVLGVAFFAIALSKVIHDPTMQSYVGDRVPYRQRGRALAVTEFSWGAALLLGAPLVGWLMSRGTWYSPYLVLGLAAGAFAVALRVLLPIARPRNSRTATLGQALTVIRGERVVWAVCVYTLCLMAANEVFFIVFGDWMESRFGLGLTELGLVSVVIGVAELVGSTAVAGWSDRIGKRRVVLLAGLLNAIIYALIPFTAATLPLALITLFLLFFSFETTIVASIPLITQVLPRARSTVMSTMLASLSLGRALGAFLGPRVWDGDSLRWNGLLAALMMIVAMFVVRRFIHEGEEAEDEYSS